MLCLHVFLQVLSVLNKGFFADSIMNLHLHIFADLQTALGCARNEARRSFMKCVCLAMCVRVCGFEIDSMMYLRIFLLWILHHDMTVFVVLL